MTKREKTGKLGLFVGNLLAVASVTLIVLSSLFFVLQKPETARAAVSDNLNFQGRLMNASGSIVADGYYNIEFKIYNASSSSGSSQGSCTGDTNCLWTETYYDSNGATAGNDNRLRVVNGYFSANLGSLTAFSGINWDQQLWITMNVGGSTQTATPTYDGEMSPRLKLTAVPYAFEAGSAANVASNNTNAGSTNSDSVSISTGNALGASSNSGSITMDVGTATGTAGTISVGTSNASAITIGRTGVTTTNTGALTVTQAFTANGGATIVGATTINVTGSANTQIGNATGTFQLDSNTIDITTAGAISGVTGITMASGNFTQSGAGTFSTGSGAVTLGGATTVNGSQFTNNGATLNTAASISNVAGGGNIGTAATTVDVDTTFNVNQTTAGQTLTLPTPTDTTAGRIAYVNNVGSASFTMYGSVIASGQSNAFIWNGSSWVTTVSLSGSVVNTIGTIDSQTKSADGAVISLNAIYLQTADATYPGLVSTGTQTFAGNKTFNGSVDIASGSSLTVDTNVLVVNAAGNNIGIRRGQVAGNVLTITNTTTTDNILVLQDNGVDVFTVADGGGVTATGLLTGTAGATISGATTSINDSSNFATNINTGTSTGAVSIGNSAAGAIAIQSGSTVSIIGTGASYIDFAEFDVSSTTGSVTINDGGDAGNISIEGSILDINSLDFVGAGTISTGTATALTINSGTTGTIAIGDDASAETINIGTGAAAKTVTLGSTNTTSTTNINAGSGGVVLQGTVTGAATDSIICRNGSNQLSTCGGNTLSGYVTLQNAYANGNSITTTDNRNIAFNLADTATDADFIVDILGTGNTFEVRDSGSAFFTAADGQLLTYSGGNAGQFSLSSDLSGGSRSSALVSISQGSGANDNSSNVVSISNSDTGSTSAVLSVSQSAAGNGILVTSASNGGGVAIAGVTSGTGFAASSLTTGNAFSTGANITTGAGYYFNLTSNTGITSGSALRVNGAASGALSAYTGSLISMNPTRTLTSGSIDDTGNFLNLARSNTVNNAGSTFTVSGDVANLSSNCTQTAGTCTDTGNILELNQQYASASGAVLNILNSGSGYGLVISSTNDITTATNQDLTVVADGTGEIVLNDSVIIGAASGSPGTVEKLRVGAVSTVDNTAVTILSSVSAANTALVVQGVGSQTGDLFIAQDSTGAGLIKMSAAGGLGVGTGATSGFYNENGELGVVNNVGGGTIWVGLNGKITAANSELQLIGRDSKKVVIKNEQADVVVATVQGFTAQTANLQEWQNSTGTVLASISSGGLFTGTAGATISGATTSINASSNFATNINTGTSTGAVTIGGGSGTFAVDSTAFDVTTAGAVSGVTTLSTSGIITAGALGAADSDTLLCRNTSNQISTCSSTFDSSVTLQDAYTNSSSPATITTADNKNVVFSLADTATDADFIVDILGTGNTFEVRDSGSAVLTVADGGAVTLANSLNVNGNTTLGDASSDDIIFTGYVNSSLTFSEDAARTISIETRTSTGAGRDLSVTAGRANTSGVGGDLNLTGGRAEGATQGGQVYITGGFGLVGGDIVIDGGNGTTDGDVYINANESGKTAIGLAEGATVDAQLHVQSIATGRVAGIIQGTASQSADIFQVLNSSDTELFSVEADGDVYGTGSYTFSGVTTDITTGTNEDLTLVANGSGTISLNDTVTVAGLLTAQAGATISGATTSINASSNFATNINTGTSTGAVTIGGGSGTVAINSSDWDISTTGDLTGIGAVTMDGNFSQTGATTFSTGTGAVSLNGNTSVTGSNTFSTGTGTVTLQGNTNVSSTVSLATAAGTTYTTAGSANDVAISTASLYRLDTAGAAQTITGIAAGRDGQILTLVNADAALAVTLSNESASSAAANRITTGTGADITVPAGASTTLIYDSTSTRWRVVGGVAATGGGANQQLSNLSGTVAVNASLTTGSDNTLDLGSAAFSWRTLYADTSVLTPSVDVAAAGALSIGNTTATSVSICNSAACDTIALGSNADADTITVGDSTDTVGINGDVTVTGDGGTGVALTVNGGTSTGNILNVQDNGTNVLSVADGGAVTLQNTSDSTSGFKVMDADGGTSVFNVDTTNERVGIGDDTPDATLDIEGSNNTTVIATNLTNTSTNAWVFAQSNTVVIDPTADQECGFLNCYTVGSYNAINSEATDSSEIESVTVGLYGYDHQGGGITLDATGIQVGVSNTGSGSITSATGLYISAVDASTTAYGISVAAISGATSSYGVAIGEAGTQTLWLQGDSGTAASGIGFGSGRDTNLYRSAADTLRTNDALVVDGLLTGSLGATISGATTSINASSNFATNINTGTSTGAVTIGGGSGTVAINSSDWDISTTGDMTGIGAITMDGNFSQTGATTFGTGTGAVSLNGNTSVTGSGTFTTGTGTVTLQGNTNVEATASFATKAGTTYTTAGSANNVAISTASLYILDTSGAAQTITGIAAGRDGQYLTLINGDASLSVTLSNESASSTAANRIVTGTGSDLTIPAGASVSLIYDNSNTRWRIVGISSNPSGYANTSLSNLSSVAINASLTPNADNTLDLGSATFSWRTLYADTSVLTPSVDVAAAGALSIGDSTATSVSICNSAACDTITIGSNADADTITVGDASDDVSITDANWSITGAGLITTADDVAINGGDLTTSAATFNLLNTNATTINFGGAATALNIGAAGGLTVTPGGNVTFAQAHNKDMTIQSSLAAADRTTDVLTITQASDATYNNSASLLQLNQLDVASSGPVMYIDNDSTTAGAYGLVIDNANTTNTGSAIRINGVAGANVRGVDVASISTGTALYVANSITSGNGLLVNTAINGWTSGDAIDISGAATGITADFSGNYIYVAPTRTLTAAATRTESGNFLELTRSNTVNGASSVMNITGDLATLSSTCTQTLGTCTDTSNILELTQSYASASGAVLNVVGAGTGNLASLDASNSSANGVLIDIQSSSSSQYGLRVTTNNAGSTALSVNGDGSISMGVAGTTTTVNGAMTVTQTLTANGTFTLGDNGDTGAIDTSDWDISTTGDLTGIGAITMDGLLTGTAGATLSGAAISLNASSNFATNINTGTSTGAVTIGGGSGTVAINSSDWDISTTGDMTNIGAITMDGLLTGTAGATISGAATSINASSNFATNINTGTSTGAVSIGNSAAGAIAIQSASTIGLTGTTTITGLGGGSTKALVVNNSTSTGNIFEAQDNGSAVLTVADGGNVNMTADLDVGSQIAAGSTASITAGQVLTIAETFTDTSGVQGGISNISTANPGAASTGVTMAAYNEALSTDGNAYNHGALFGAENKATHNGDGNLTYLVGSYDFASVSSQNAGGTIAAGIGVQGQFDNWGTATVTAAMGVYGYSKNAGAGSIVTNAGMASIATNTGSGNITTNYGLTVNNSLTSTGNITDNYGVNIASFSDTGAGAITGSNYGIAIQAQATSATDYGLYIADAGEYSVYLASTDYDAASGITFAGSANLYAGAADMLKTDDSVHVVGKMQIGSAANVGTVAQCNSILGLGSCTSNFETYTESTETTNPTWGINNATMITPSAATNSSQNKGINNVMVLQGTQSFSSTNYGIDSVVYNYTSAGTTTLMAGVMGYAAQIGAGSTVSSAVGVRAGVAQSAGTLTDGYGLQVISATGTISGNNYGIYVQNQTVGATDYGIYVADAANYSLMLASNDGDAASGITFGTTNGANLYRSAADTLKTDDSFIIGAATTFGTQTSAQSCAISCTITQANVDGYSAVLINATASSLTVTMPDPTTTTAGKVVYVTAVDGSNDFTLRLNSGGTQVDISMRENTTATLIWNGSDWTAAGASSSTDLQAAYNNTLTSAGGAELVLNAAGGAADGLTVRNNATTPITGALLEVQTSIGSNLLSVNNNATEYASNGGAESSTFTAWTATPTGGTVTRYTTTGDYVATGQGSVSVVTGAVANEGVENTLSTTLTANLKYVVSFAVRGTANFSTLDVYYSKDGSATTSCATGQTATTGRWTRITCSFTAPSSGITASNSIFIRQSDGTARTFYVDNLSVTVGADVNHAADGSVDSALGTNWTNFGTLDSLTRDTTTIYDTSGAVAVDTPNSADRGVRNNLSITPSTSTQYLVTFYAKSSNSFSDIRVRYSRDGGTDFESCVDYNTQTVSTSTWTEITCTFTTDSTAATDADLIIDQTTASDRTFYIDALSVTLNTNTANNVQVGGANKGGPTTLFTLDRGSSAPVAENNDAYLGSMYYDTTTGRIQCYEADGWGACGAAPDNIVNLNPEYAGAVLNGTGVGTMTTDFCSDDTALTVNASLCETGEAKNFYKWTSPQATSQTYSIYVTYQLPATFRGFSSDDTVQLVGRVDSTTNAEVTYEMYKSTGSAVTQCGSGETDVIAGGGDTANVWHEYGINGNESTGCSFSSSSAGNFIIFKINLKANSNANAYVSTLSFTTTGQ